MKSPKIHFLSTVVLLGLTLVFSGCGSSENSQTEKTELADKTKNSDETDQTDKAENLEEGEEPEEIDLGKEEPVDQFPFLLKPNPLGDFIWEVSGNLVTIIKCKASGKVVLPKVIAGFPVGRIGSLVSDANTLPRQFREGNAIPDGVTALVIPDSLKSIGDGAFYGCKSLTRLKIPDEVTSVGKYAFYGCENLRNVTYGTKLTSIGDGAFYGCSRLTEPTLPDSLTYIGKKAFERCSSFTGITIPIAVNSIANSAFNGLPPSGKHLGV